MPTVKSAAKRLRQNEKQRQHNRARRTRIRSLVKAIRNEPAAPETADRLKEVSVLLDRYGTRGLHHANKANRMKSRLTRLVSNAASQ